MGLEGRWQRRWRERATPGQNDGSTSGHQLREAIQLRHSAAVVWALVHPAENSLRLAPDSTARAFSVAGAGSGLGEQQCHIDHHGQATITEVIEYVHERWAVIKVVSPEAAVDVQVVTAVEACGDGCLLTFGANFDPSQKMPGRRRYDAAWRKHALEYLERVRRVLEADSAALLAAE